MYNSLLPLTKEDSPMSIHYAKYASKGRRVEWIGTRQRYDCIKIIQVDSRREEGRRWETLPTNFLFFSPDGTRILSNSEHVCVWEATSGELVAGPLAGDDETDALTAAYLPDGRYIIVVGRDGVLRKWDTLTNYLVWKRETNEEGIDLSRVVSAILSPDGKSVVFGDAQGSILVLNVDTGKLDSGPLKGHTDSICCLSFSSDGQYFASGSDDTTIKIWDMDRREMKTGPLEKHTQRVTAVNFSPNGTNVVSGSKDGTILVWNTITGEMLRSIKCENKVYSVTYSPNGLLILAGGYQWMSMWSTVNMTAPPKVFQVRPKKIWRLSFSPDNNRFVSVSGFAVHTESVVRTRFENDKIQIWDASWEVEETKTTFKEQGQIWSIALSPSGEFIASGSSDGSIYLYDVLTGELVKKIKHNNYTVSVSFSPINEQLIAFGSIDGTVQVWDVTNDKPVTIGNHMESADSVVFSPSGGIHVASGSQDKTICIWNIERKELVLGPLAGHESPVYAMAYSPDGTRLVSGSSDKTIRIWDSVTGDLLSTLNGHSQWVNSVAYSSDGSRIVSGSDDNTIRVWDAQSGETVCGPITRHKGDVVSVCFSPDGERILSGSRDCTARVWDSRTGQPLFPPFRGHTHWVTSVCFFPDGRRFATGSEDGTIRIWTLESIPSDTNWELRDDNWVVDENGKLMMWIPDDLHTHLYHPRNTDVFGRSFYLKLNFDTE